MSQEYFSDFRSPSKDISLSFFIVRLIDFCHDVLIRVRT